MPSDFCNRRSDKSPSLQKPRRRVRKLLDSYSSGVGSPEVKECPSVPILCKSWGVEQRGVEKFAYLATQKGHDESSV
jgi:hypothetical protein